jgi:hypothetical protein
MKRLFALTGAMAAALVACGGDNATATNPGGAPPGRAPRDAGVVWIDAGQPVCGAMGELCCEGNHCDGLNTCQRGRCAPPPDAGCGDADSVNDCCGVVCTSSDPSAVVACVDGVCRTATWIGAGDPHSAGLAADDGALYYTTLEDGGLESALVRAPLDGGTPTALATIDLPGRFAATATDVYVADYPTGIVRVPKDGGASTRITEGHDGTFGVALDDHAVYFGVRTGGLVLGVPFDGGIPETLATGLSVPQDVATAAGRLFWTAGDAHVPGDVWTRPLDGGAPTHLASGQPNPTGIVADDSYVYWIDFDDGDVHRVPVGGGTVELLAPHDGTEHIAIDEAGVYWTRYYASTAADPAVRRFLKSTGTVSTLATGGGLLGAITAHGGTVYWLASNGAWSTPH